MNTPFVGEELVEFIEKQLTPLSDVDATWSHGELMYVHGQHNILEVLKRLNKKNRENVPKTQNY